MKANDTIEPAAQLARGFTTLLLILLGIIAVQFIIVQSAWIFWPRPPAPPAPADQSELSAEEARIERIQLAEKQFLPDGTLHLLATVSGPQWRSPHTPAPPTTEKQVYDVNDQLLWEGQNQDNPHTYLTWASETRPDSFDHVHDMDSVRTIVNAAILQIPVATEDRLLKAWRYYPWNDCFVGHDLENQSTEYLGATGPAASKKEAEPFGPFRNFLAWWSADSYSPTLLWQTDRRIYQISFAKQQVDLVFESPKSSIDRIYIQQWDSYRANAANTKNARSLLHCRTDDGKHYLILTNPGRTIAVTTPSEWNQWLGNDLEFSATSQDVFMRRNWIEYAVPTRHKWDWLSQYRATARTQWVELYRVSDAGQVEPLNRFSWTIPAQPRQAPPIRFISPYTSVRPNVNAFSPLLCDLVWSAGVRRYKSEYREIGQLIEGMRPGYRLRNWVVTAVLLTLTLLHVRSRKASKAAIVFWLVLVGLFNLAGFLTYWALNHTPTIKCSACGKRRGLTPTDCVRCGAPLPTPEHGKLDLVFGV